MHFLDSEVREGGTPSPTPETGALLRAVVAGVSPANAQRIAADTAASTEEELEPRKPIRVYSCSLVVSDARPI